MRILNVALILGALNAATVALPAAADDLRGADRLLCSILSASACWQDGKCAYRDPAELNIPQFIQVNLDRKELRTTPASGENRSTPVGSVTRADGSIALQGYENGRAFSLVIEEETGRATFASASGARAVVIFGACTVSN